MVTSIVLNASISEEPLDLAGILSVVGDDGCGAVVGFSGVVRDHDGGKAVSRLTYTCHPSAPKVMQDIADDVASRHEGVRIWVAHRVGDLLIGDSALVAAVASAHRAEAFAAGSELVEKVKYQVPIWKEQFFTDGGTEWVGSGSAQ
ncbi:molybdenum cofactor biosynthesis protein MoaE [Arthrobacter roseus]|uniref:molybdenum cofactor biosynthesis protein MoaE n=1 Tax=Arthrobacter roseus TaxID=136274 RepID=UPI001962637F|nr:molybdopterin synthase catalytic subunit [Arthrobacter roseus]